MSLAVPLQRSFDDLGTPLYDVTFCVVDLETTGGSAAEGGITELGAVKLRGGEHLGSFQTMVNPGQAIPPSITVLTGITEAMVLPAPRIESVLPTLLEFIGNAVIVGHNVRYDLSFLAAACDRAGYARLSNQWIDTYALARRLLRDEVPNHKLSTLASRLRLDHRPSHRALEDALATGDLLHVLLERAGGLGVTGLDDLLQLPTIAGHEQAAKLKLTAQLPRAPGVYLFRDRGGRVLYVGKATDLRARVRSYFSSDTRRKVGQLLRETQRIDHEVCSSVLEAAVREVRLIHQLQPRFNRHAKSFGKYAYVKLTLNEPYPRLSCVREAKPDGGFYLGPLSSMAAAKRVAEAIESVVPLRRCTARLSARGGTREAPCAPAQLGVATCPCANAISAPAYAAIVDQTVRGLTREPDLLLGPLAARMQALAASERFEEAVDVRDRAAALTHAMRRQRRIDALRRSGRMVLDLPGGAGAVLEDGRMIDAWGAPTTDPDAEDVAAPRLDLVVPMPVPSPETIDATERTVATQLALDVDPVRRASSALPPVARHEADELTCVLAHLDAKRTTARLVHCENGWASPLPALPTFEPRAVPTSPT